MGGGGQIWQADTMQGVETGTWHHQGPAGGEPATPVSYTFHLW